MTSTSVNPGNPLTPAARLAGRTAVVTGATSGLGAAIARTLAGEGAHVVASGRDAARGKDVVEEIRGAGGRADFVEADLAGSYEQLRAFAADATSALGGRVDILVNNAGLYPTTTTAELPDADLDAMLAVNVRAPHVLVGTLAPAMAERGSGAIIN
ncbi:SDR family NAD(P)-dependent oxidoreductase, partial [Streptomyces sp. NPDC002920]